MGDAYYLSGVTKQDRIRVKKEVLKGMATVKNRIKKGNGIPKEIVMKDDKGKAHKLDKKHYMGIFEATNVFRLKQGRYPNYTTLNSTANNPLIEKQSCTSVKSMSFTVTPAIS